MVDDSNSTDLDGGKLFRKVGFFNKAGLNKNSEQKPSHFSLKFRDRNRTESQEATPKAVPQSINEYGELELSEALNTKPTSAIIETKTATPEITIPPIITEAPKKVEEKFISPIMDLATIRIPAATQDIDFTIDKNEYICPDKKITDEELKALLNKGKYKYLDLSNCYNIKDFSDLRYQTELVQLSLAGNDNFTNCGILSNLNKLKVLDLASTDITDIESIKNLLNLQVLNIKFTNIKDLSPIERLPNLRDLTIMGCAQINTIAPVAHAKELRLLDATDALGVFDISPVKSLPKIENLLFDYCPLESIDPIRELYTLKLFSLESKNLHIRHIDEVFKDLTEIRYLSLRKARLNTINGFRKLNKMIAIDIGYGNFVDISPLENMVNMKRAIIDENSGIVDISPLHKMSKLEDLDLSGNRITDISVFKNLPKVNSLVLDTNVLLKDLAPMEYLLEMCELSMKGCVMISDLYPLRNMKNLAALIIAKCPRIKDISFLKNMPSLKVLDIDSTSIPYEQVGDLKNCLSLSVFSLIGSNEHYRRTKRIFKLRRKWNKLRQKLHE